MNCEAYQWIIANPLSRDRLLCEHYIYVINGTTIDAEVF